MHMDPIMLPLVAIIVAVLVIGIVATALHQPGVVGYLLAGIAVGPFGLAVIDDKHLIERLGEIGVLLLLFFIGMETSPSKLATQWRLAVIGVLSQILLTLASVAALGYFLDWPIGRIVLLGFVLSLSSTAVVLNYLKERNELQSKLGQQSLVVLLSQDIAIVPMMIILAGFAYSAGDSATGMSTGLLQMGGAVILLGLFIWMALDKPVKLPFAKTLKRNHELQLFAALLLCFSAALLTGLAQLSTALGAFMGGMIIGAAKETDWVHHQLDSLRVLFVALFFMSVGLLVDIPFVLDNIVLISLVVVGVMVLNTLINAAIFKALGDNWSESLQLGAILAQIGEFSFVLTAVGMQSGLISDFGYQLIIAVIACSLILSPSWIMLWNKIVKPSA